jgi:hypothetical protein
MFFSGFNTEFNKYFIDLMLRFLSISHILKYFIFIILGIATARIAWNSLLPACRR